MLATTCLFSAYPEQRLESHYSQIHVFANGTFLTTIDLRARLAASEYCVLIPRRALCGPWVEISLRPKGYLGDAQAHQMTMR